MTTDWLPCRKCRATTRHDDEVCIRDPKNVHTARWIENVGREATATALVGLHREERSK